MLARLTNGRMVISGTCPGLRKHDKSSLREKKNGSAGYWAGTPSNNGSGIMMLSAALMSTSFQEVVGKLSKALDLPGMGV